MKQNHPYEAGAESVRLSFWYRICLQIYPPLISQSDGMISYGHVMHELQLTRAVKFGGWGWERRGLYEGGNKCLTKFGHT